MPSQRTQEALDKLKNVRCADVADALDSLGMPDTGFMDPGIRPVWKPVKMVGIAKTIVLVPRQGQRRYDSFEDYLLQTQVGYVYLKKGTTGVREWENPLDKYLRSGERLESRVLVYDSGGIPAGFWGSEISLRAQERGVVGTVIDGGCRDTEEIELQQYPVFTRHIAPTNGGLRLHPESIDVPVKCGGVIVKPGDIILGDTDGVVVIPQDLADQVADRALAIHQQDLQWRRLYYEQLGKQPDSTVTE
jgi:4-hydroxy-4-methyl-2-oxoglutarate aldolase